MSFAPLREYFRARILEIDSSFREHANAFDTDNVPNSNLNQTFLIKVGPLAGNSVNQNTTDDSIQVEVRLLYSGAKDPARVDAAMDQGNALRLNCMSPKKMALSGSLRRVFCSSVEPVVRESNSDTVEIVMSFIVRTAFAIG